jgi:hypothetical protein
MGSGMGVGGCGCVVVFWNEFGRLGMGVGVENEWGGEGQVYGVRNKCEG